MDRPRIKRGLRLAITAGTIAFASHAWGRAGGGGHFSGGGGGHSSGGGGFSGGGGHFSGGGFGGHSSGGGTGSGDPTVLLIIVAIVIAIFVINSLLERNRKQAVRRGDEAIDLSAGQALARQLRLADPAFDPARFYQRISGAFLKIQDAWSRQDVRVVQSFVSDGVAERFGLQFREQQDLGFRNQMEQVRVSRVMLAKVTCGEVFEAATVRIDASAIDYDADLRDGRFRGGARTPQPFTEYWTFLRRQGTASTAGNGLLEGRCPNCGAEIQISQHVTCDHCGALLRSGRYDWVLCEITQASEWRPSANRTVAGLDAIRAADPGLSIDSLEDRAAVIFWRHAESDRTGNTAVLRKVAVDEFLTGSADGLNPTSSARRWLGEIGVGAIDVASFSADDTFDRAMVHVAWSGTRFSQNGNAVKSGDETSVIRETFVLARRRGVLSDPDQGITSAHCLGCGAPISSSLGNGCESCGRVLNDGSQSWVLESIESGWSDRAALLQPTQPSSRGLLNWVIQTAAADGQIDAKERVIIQSFARKAAAPPGEVDTLIAAAQAGRLDAPAPSDRHEVDQWLKAMIGVALVDGRLAKGETRLIQSVAVRAGLGDADIRLLIRKEQARQFAAGKAALRGLQ